MGTTEDHAFLYDFAALRELHLPAFRRWSSSVERKGAQIIQYDAHAH
jgi:hypothetical protein